MTHYTARRPVPRSQGPRTGSLAWIRGQRLATYLASVSGRQSGEPREARNVRPIAAPAPWSTGDMLASTVDGWQRPDLRVLASWLSEILA